MMYLNRALSAVQRALKSYLASVEVFFRALDPSPDGTCMVCGSGEGYRQYGLFSSDFAPILCQPCRLDFERERSAKTLEYLNEIERRYYSSIDTGDCNNSR